MNRIHSRILSMVLWVSLLAGCSLPAPATPFAIPTPDLTMTAIFRPTETVPPSVTPPAVVTATPAAGAVASPSPVPTQTAASASETAEPTKSSSTATTGPVTGPLQRSGVSVKAGYLPDPPVLDGNLDEWDGEVYQVVDVVFGGANHTNSADLSARMMAGWDEANLYLAVWVDDDVFVQNEVGLYLYQGDSVEVLLDTDVRGDFYSPILSFDDYQLGISPGSPPGSNPQAYLWYPATAAGPRQQVEVSAGVTVTGYRMEIAIPWSLFNTSPVAGDHYGFGFSVSDNDSPGASVQESMVSILPDRNFLDPTTWGDLTLLAP